MGSICTKNVNVVTPSSPDGGSERNNRSKNQRVVIEEREMTMREMRVSVENFKKKPSIEDFKKTPKKVKRSVIRQHFDHESALGKSPNRRGRRSREPTSDTTSSSSVLTDDEEVPGNREVMESRPSIDYIIGLDLHSGVYGVGVWFMNRVRIMSGTFTNMCASGIRLSFYKKLEEEQHKQERNKFTPGIRKEKSRVFHPLHLLGHSSAQKKQIDIARRLLPYDIVQSTSPNPQRKISEEVVSEEDMRNSSLPSRVLIQVIDGDSGDEVIVSPGDIVQHHIRKMKQDAKKFLRKSIQHSVAVLPIDLNYSQREELNRLFKRSRLKIMRTMTGATAAGLTYGYKNFEKDDTEEHYVLVLNHGYASLNISLMQVQFNVYEVLSTVGSMTLGGTFFVLDLVEEALARIQSKTGMDHSGNVDARTVIRMECENILTFFGDKKGFAEDDKYKVTFDLYPQRYASMSSRPKVNQPVDLTFTLSELETLFARKYEKCVQLMESVINDSKISKSQISNVVTVGVMAGQQKFRDLVSDFFRNDDEEHDDVAVVEHLEESSIVYGAALLGAMIQQHVKIVLVDALPFGIGIKTSSGEVDDDDEEEEDTVRILKRFSPTPSTESFFFKIEDTDEVNNFSIEVVEIHCEDNNYNNTSTKKKKKSTTTSSTTSTEPHFIKEYDEVEIDQLEEEEKEEKVLNKTSILKDEESVRVFNFIGVPEGEKDLIVRVDVKVDVSKQIMVDAFVVEKMEKPIRRNSTNRVRDDDNNGTIQQLLLLEDEYDRLFDYPKSVETI